MRRTIVRINFEYTCSEAELEGMANELKDTISDVNGLVWKVWTHNAEDALSGGIYLFEDRDAAEAYVNGPIGDEMRDHPELSNLEVNYFDIMEEPSRATSAPVFGEIGITKNN